MPINMYNAISRVMIHAKFTFDSVLKCCFGVFMSMVYYYVVQSR